MPRVLTDVSVCRQETSLLGTPVRSPVVLAPVGLAALAHPDGEVAAAKALALGARACMIGRSWVYGLAAGGQHGVEVVLELLRAKIDTALALLGRPALADLDPSCVSVPACARTAAPPWTAAPADQIW